MVLKKILYRMSAKIAPLLVVILSILYVGMNYLLQNWRHAIDENVIVNLKEIIILITLLLGWVYIFIWLLKYLAEKDAQKESITSLNENKGEIKRFLNDKDYIEQYINIKIDKKVQQLKNECQEAAINFSDDDKKKILADIQAKLETDAFQSYVDQIRENVTSRTKEDTLADLFKQIVRRLSGEISALSRRGNVNLILGIGISIAGIMFLGYSVIHFTTEGCGSNLSEQCTEILLTYFLPRFSLVILVEIFAYFFLRLYKQSLDEIKYYQNEITNIEAKQLALQLAMRHEDQQLRTKVAEELAKTERNFILQKDQSTVEIEREKLASNNHANLINALKDMINNKKSG